LGIKISEAIVQKKQPRCRGCLNLLTVYISN
jgi:hypothetical protein